MKLPLDAQFAVGNQAPKAQDSDVNIPTGSKNLKEEDNQMNSGANAMWKYLI